MNLGERVKAFRKAQFMTQLELGKKIGNKSAQTVTNIESGKRKPKIGTVQKIADALNVPLETLLGEPDMEPQKEYICPFRIHGEKTMSATVAGEYFYNEYFMPCMKRKCPCYYEDCGDGYCNRNGANMNLGRAKE